MSLCELSNGYLVSGSTSGPILIWSLDDVDATKTTSSDADVVDGDDDGDGDDDDGVLRYRIKGLRVIRSLRTLKGHRNWVRCIIELANSNYGIRIASASQDETVKIWDIEAGVCLRTIKGHSESVHAVISLRKQRPGVSGEIIVSGAADKCLMGWIVTDDDLCGNSSSERNGKTEESDDKDDDDDGSDDGSDSYDDGENGYDEALFLCETQKQVLRLIPFQNGSMACSLIDGRIQLWNLCFRYLIS